MGCCASTLAFAGDRARALAGGLPVTTELLAGNVVDRLLAEAATEYAVAHARARGARLHVVHVWRTPAVSPYAVTGDGILVDLYQEDTCVVAEGVDRWREKNPDVEITHEAWIGHPVSVLTEAAASADLVVVGSRGLGGFASAIMGSVGHGVLHHVTCPVAVVRPRAWRRAHSSPA